MAAKISVEPLPDGAFQVRVVEGTTESSHRVTAKPEYLARLTSEKINAAEIVRRSFEFLIEREPKESILSRFDLQEIQRYFPSFDAEIRKRLALGSSDRSADAK